uniref:Uncharacterized protein n=1 Tax=Avena sativa TaxID=4498 RepID=A0ACD5XN73_AVESA
MQFRSAAAQEPRRAANGPQRRQLREEDRAGGDESAAAVTDKESEAWKNVQDSPKPKAGEPDRPRSNATSSRRLLGPAASCATRERHGDSSSSSPPRCRRARPPRRSSMRYPPSSASRPMSSQAPLCSTYTAAPAASATPSLGRGDETFPQFMEMRRNGADTDMFTFASMLKSIGNSSSLLEGRQVHALILKGAHDSNVNVQNGLISMYARHGEIGESSDISASARVPDLVSWNSLLSGYAQHGYGQEVVEVFERMRRLNVQPDNTTFLMLLAACSHGLVDKGLDYFNLMKTNGFLAEAQQEHYACIVDLLGRAGHLQEAESLVHDMPIEPGVSVYRTLLSACQIHGNLEIAIRVSTRLIELYPRDSSAHVQLSKAFAGDGHWGSAAEVRETMARKGIVKNPAWSCVEDQMQVV